MPRQAFDGHLVCELLAFEDALADQNQEPGVQHLVEGGVDVLQDEPGLQWERVRERRGVEHDVGADVRGSDVGGPYVVTIAFGLPVRSLAVVEYDAEGVGPALRRSGWLAGFVIVL